MLFLLYFFYIAVGFWEEFAFRGLIFTALCRILSFKPALITSSIYFSLWHFDVYTNSIAFIEAFLISSVFTTFYYLGVSLLSLSIIHFLWDQVHFGFFWHNSHSSNLYDLVKPTYELAFVLLSFHFG